VASIRDYRRQAYFNAVRTELGPCFADFELGLDQVLYHPGRLVCAPSPDDPSAGVGDLVTAARAACGGGRRQTPKTRPGGNGLEPCVVDLPPMGGLDAYALACELERDYPGQVSPLLYSVCQQYVQPGEDPEPSPPVPALVAAYGAGPADARTLGKGIQIGVIDTGVDVPAITEAKLGTQIKFTQDDVDHRTDPSLKATAQSYLLGPAAGHGTFIASLIGAVAPGAVVRSYKVANTLGIADEVAIQEGIRRAIKDGCQVINLSLGGYPFAGTTAVPTLRAFSILEAAIAEIDKKVAIVAAAGNCASGDRFYPAAFEGVIGVAALEADGRLWEHSNYGTWVRACARGVGLRGLFVKGKENPVYDPDGRADEWTGKINFATWSGTSFAAPLVAAQIAVVASAMKLEHNTREAAERLLGMSKPPFGSRPCGNRVLVDLPGQT
jgi:subtilisin family serine protease